MQEVEQVDVVQVIEVIGLSIALHIFVKRITQIAVTIHIALFQLFNHQG